MKCGVIGTCCSIVYLFIPFGNYYHCYKAGWVDNKLTQPPPPIDYLLRCFQHNPYLYIDIDIYTLSLSLLMIVL